MNLLFYIFVTLFLLKIAGGVDLSYWVIFSPILLNVFIVLFIDWLQSPSNKINTRGGK